jgi:hypothetical protein
MLAKLLRDHEKITNLLCKGRLSSLTRLMVRHGWACVERCVGVNCASIAVNASSMEVATWQH